MKLVLPYPPTANLYWRVWRGRAVKSNEARKYQKDVRLKAIAAGAACPMAGPVVLEILLCRPRRIGDLDNGLKVALDALKGILFIDDGQVVEIHARRCEDPGNPRLEVRARGEFHPELQLEPTPSLRAARRR